MRHKYKTRGIVLSRTPLGEANTLVMLLTPELGLVHARAQGLRKSGAKLSTALTTFAERDIVLVRGKESWRVAGAVLIENWFARFGSAEARARAGRICNLLLRLVAGEARDRKLFPIVKGFFNALAALPQDAHESAEVLAALRMLSALGLDAGTIPGEPSVFTQPLLIEVLKNKTKYISRINHGLNASGL